MSNLVHKIKDAVTSDKHSQPEGTHGIHNSTTANAADPRIDSDRDHRAAPGAHTAGAHPAGAHTTGTHGTGAAVGSAGMAGNPGVIGTGGLDNRGVGGPAPGTDGPHKSNMMNKADPRVDSDRDHSRNMGANPSGTATTGNYTTDPTGTTGGFTSGTHGHTDTTGMTGTHGHTGTTGMTGTTGSSGLTGTHGHTGTSGMTGTTGSSGLTGTHGHTGTTGTSGMTGTHGHTGTTGTSGMTGGLHSSGPGPAPNTAGPHKSDMMNKADPRVDSNLDGSKTVGGDKTFNQSNNMASKDPTDATQVPPSVLRQSVGGPTIEHDDPHHNREARHSVSHQETHRGL